ncbi:MAG: YdbL family protein [Betaproteobacteria bacterium]|nr:YdbL family protein [Betaproteobacteria bacterium]
MNAIKITLSLCLLLAVGLSQAQAQGNLEVNTPAIAQLQNSMQSRYLQLAPLLGSGAVGLARDGTVQLRDPNAVPLAQRQAANSLVAAENADRSALYREIARANGKPEWEGEIRATFGQRWIDKAQSGWWVQDARGNWMRK